MIIKKLSNIMTHNLISYIILQLLLLVNHNN